MTILNMSDGTIITLPLVTIRDHTPRTKTSPDKFWDVIDEQIDYLMYLGHARACQCCACSRRDRLIALLLEGIS